MIKLRVLVLCLFLTGCSGGIMESVVEIMKDCNSTPVITVYAGTWGNSFEFTCEFEVSDD